MTSPHRVCKYETQIVGLQVVTVDLHTGIKLQVNKPDRTSRTAKVCFSMSLISLNRHAASSGPAGLVTRDSTNDLFVLSRACWRETGERRRSVRKWRWWLVLISWSCCRTDNNGGDGDAGRDNRASRVQLSSYVIAHGVMTSATTTGACAAACDRLGTSYLSLRGK